MRVCLIALVSVACGACAVPAPGPARYIVNAAPLSMLPACSRLCVAVDPNDARGVWWWEPGKSGCSSRSTGPTVFPAERAEVRHAPDAIDVQFEIPLQSGNPLPIKLTIAQDGIRNDASGERVPIARRNDLDIPEVCCPPTASR
jgi:hypothetical protein